MIMFEDLFESENQRERFRIVSNKLLNHCFILKKKDETRSDYFHIMGNVNIFRDFFFLLGFDLMIAETQCVICLKNRYGTGRLQFTKTESIVLLILRLLFLEKKSDLSSLADEVVVTMMDINEKYKALDVKDKTVLTQQMEKNIISLFKRLNLILNLDKDVNQSECRILIYPSILMAVPVESITECYEKINEKLNEYKGDIINGTESNDDEENFDETSSD